MQCSWCSVGDPLSFGLPVAIPPKKSQAAGRPFNFEHVSHFCGGHLQQKLPPSPGLCRVRDVFI